MHIVESLYSPIVSMNDFEEDREQLNYMIEDGPEASLQGVFLDLSKSYISKNQDKLHLCVQFVVVYIRPKNP